MDKTTIARHIKREWAKFRNLVEENKREISNPSRFLEPNGYEVVGSGWGAWYATKNGLTFYLGRYSSTYTLHIDYGFHVGGRDGKYFRIFNVEENVDGILSAGYVLPENHYVRSAEVEECITAIKAEIDKAKSIIGGGYGERGDKLYRNGYKVGYDGGSVCSFSKGFMHFSAYNYYPKGWRIEDKFNVYVGDDVLSVDFSVDGDRYLNLDKDFEAIFGDVPTFGRELTEKDKVGQYKSFRVRSYVPKELSTIKRFDNIEDAKAFAYKTAKDYAEGVKDDRSRYAYTNPVDISDRYDYLAAYMWYKYDRGSEHFVFVQGENE